MINKPVFFYKTILNPIGISSLILISYTFYLVDIVKPVFDYKMIFLMGLSLLALVNLVKPPRSVVVYPNGIIYGIKKVKWQDIEKIDFDSELHNLKITSSIGTDPIDIPLKKFRNSKRLKSLFEQNAAENEIKFNII